MNVPAQISQMMRWISAGVAICLTGTPALADAPFLEEVRAESFWMAHLDTAAMRGTPLERFLDKLAVGASVHDLQQQIANHLGIRDLKLGSTTFMDSGDPGTHAVMILRGDFSEIAALDNPTDPTMHRGKTIAHGPQWQGAPLYLARISPNQCVVGTSRRGVERAIDRLDGVGASWQGVEAPPELRSAALVFALDMARLGALLDFEAELTRSLQRLWVVAGTRGDDVEFSISLESGDPIRLGEVERQLLSLLPLLAAKSHDAGINAPAMPRINVETQGRWLKLSLQAPPDQIAAFLNGLAAVLDGPPPVTSGTEN